MPERDVRNPAGRSYTAVSRRSVIDGSDGTRPKSNPAVLSVHRRRYLIGLRVFFACLAASLVITVIVWPQVAPASSRLKLNPNVPEIDFGSDRQAMIDTEYRGINESGEPFRVVARLIRNPESSDHHIDLFDLNGEINLTSGERVLMSAEKGSLVNDRKTMDLAGDVVLKTTGGYRINTSKAALDLDTGTLSGNVPVVVNGPFGRLESQGFKINEKGQVSTFSGRSRMIVNEPAPTGSQP